MVPDGWGGGGVESGSDQRSKMATGGPARGGGGRPPTEGAAPTLALPPVSENNDLSGRWRSFRSAPKVRRGKMASAQGRGRGLALAASPRAEAIFSSAEQRQEDLERTQNNAGAHLFSHPPPPLLTPPKNKTQQKKGNSAMMEGGKRAGAGLASWSSR